MHPLAPRHGKTSIAALLALVGSASLTMTWLRHEASHNVPRALALALAYALAAAWAAAWRRPDAATTAFRLAVGSVLLLAFSYRPGPVSIISWFVSCSLAMFALPLLLASLLGRYPSRGGRWVRHLRQVPVGYAVFVLTFLLSLLIGIALESVMGTFWPRPTVSRTFSR